MDVHSPLFLTQSDAAAIIEYWFRFSLAIKFSIVDIIATSIPFLELIHLKVGQTVELCNYREGTIRQIGDEYIELELVKWSPNCLPGKPNSVAVLPRHCYHVTRLRKQAGSFGRLIGLSVSPKFNMEIVKIVAFVEEKNRWKVKLIGSRSEKRYLGVRAENLGPIFSRPHECLKEFPRLSDRVLTKQGLYGVVRFVGELRHFEVCQSKGKAKYIGIELDEWHVNGDDEKYYPYQKWDDPIKFQTEMGFAYYATLNEIYKNISRQTICEYYPREIDESGLLPDHTRATTYNVLKLASDCTSCK